MLKPRFLIGFTGHRTGYDEALIRPALKAVLEDLQKRAAAIGGEADLYTSVAEGADTLCVQVARGLGMAVHLLLPLPQDEFAKDFSSPPAWERSRQQIELALQKPGSDSMRVLPGEMKRPDCYFDQGIRILEGVDVLVAVWDGLPEQGLGGTAQVIVHAKNLGMPVILIHSKTGQSRIEDDSSLEQVFVPDDVLAELQKIAHKAGATCVNEPGTADDLQECLDDIANDEASRFRPSLVIIILLHGIAALLAAIVTFQLAKDTLWEHWKWVFTATELLLVSYALWLSIRLHRKHTQERWIRCRFACELVRGLRASVPLVDPLNPSIGVHDPKWRRFALSVGLLVNERRALLQPDVLRDHYITTRLSETHEEGQIGHYLKKRPKAMLWWNTTGFVSKWSAQLAPVFVLLSLINKVFHLGYQKPFGGWIVVTLLPIALPLIAGVASGIRQALDAGRRKERYPEMAARLLALRTHLKGLETRATIAHTVTQTEEILLDELREWQLTATTTGH
ncbi:hypothetical protein GCM10023213_23420 [Prosthecobacter algae]|uniref:SMODS and SLOG-associating 2TM effector domain-containing protein n=1 Tax=Prosthecobacter algae TaxID=1144682 RepID=A0ABP9P5F9_9BACT